MFYLMRADELAALPAELIDVQLYTHRHRTPRDRDLFLKEITDNRASLRRALGKERRLDQFCYPFGDYVLDHVPWLELAGVEFAFTCDRGLASARSNRMLLPRVMVTSALTSLKLEAWLTGALELLPLRRSK